MTHNHAVPASLPQAPSGNTYLCTTCASAAKTLNDYSPCVTCATTAPSGSAYACGDCANLAGISTETRQRCWSCVASTSSAYACTDVCAKLPTEAARNSCLDCLIKGSSVSQCSNTGRKLAI